VLVIGGGATGAGIVRDLALRGVDCALLEAGDFCHGASGGNHGLLHSGGRYAVKDPSSASECAHENTVLRRTAPFCIEGTGGLFVSLPGDDDDFALKFDNACQNAGVKAQEVTAKEALSIEPGLNPSVETCYEVPDGSIDPFSLVLSNIDRAREDGAAVMNHCQVIAMRMNGDRVDAVEYLDGRDGQKHQVLPEVVVNAGGAWASSLARMAGVDMPMALDQGSMLVLDGRLCEHVINRLRPPSNGDIAVPNHTSTILGTTSAPVPSPERPTIPVNDADLLLREVSAMLPGCRGARAIRAYCGVRPLLGGTGGREASRSFSIFRDERAENLLSVAGGKLTTYRLMAEKVSDQACRMLGKEGHCRTHLDALGLDVPVLGKGIALAKLHRKYAGRALSIPLSDQRMICSCEQVLRSEVQYALEDPDVLTMTDVMRRTRAGLGYCQGLDCSLSVLEMFVEVKGAEALSTLSEFLDERGKGTSVPGEQVRQELLRRHLLQGVYGIGGPKE